MTARACLPLIRFQQGWALPVRSAIQGLSRIDLALLGGLALVSVGLLFWATGDAVLAAGFLAGLALAAGGMILARRLFPAAAVGEAAPTDWSMLRAAVNHDDVEPTITDRAGRLVCANDLFATWMGGFVTGLPLEGRGAGCSKMRAGPHGATVRRGRRNRGRTLRAQVLRSGQAEDYPDLALFSA